MKVLIAIDGSECSAAAVDAVADRSWPAGTTFEVITVHEALAALYCYAGTYALDSIQDFDSQALEHDRALVRRKVLQLAAVFGKDRVTGQALEGIVADTIIDRAKDWQADLIVVGSHGRRGMKRLLLGSVACAVANLAPCSIEIVKDKVAHSEKEPVLTAGARL